MKWFQWWILKRREALSADEREKRENWERNIDENTLHHLCPCCVNTSLCISGRVCLLAVFVDIDLFLSLWHVCTFSPLLLLFLGPRRRESVSVSIPAALRGRSFSHLSPPRISQSEVTASSVPPPLPPPLIHFSHPHSMSSLASPPNASRRTATFADTHQPPPPRSCGQMLTEYLFYWCQLVSHLK